MTRERPPEQRFWEFVNGPWVDERVGGFDCWRWMGATIKSRPPRLRVRKKHREYGRFHYSLEVGLINAHRAALLLTVGLPPDGDMRSTKWVAGHICNESLCVNPGHIVWQTPQQNTAQAVADGRLTRVSNGHGQVWASTGVA